MDDLPNLQELKKEESIFDSLQKNALETIRELSGQLWTDHAPHDPGITTLDILNYALSELDYQMSFPLEQYLTGSDNRFNPEDYGLFSPERVSGMAPVTPKDYRDHFLDQLDNTDFLVNLSDIQIHPYRSNDQICHGWFDIFIELSSFISEDQHKQEEKKIKEKIKKLYHTNRNLGEHLHAIHFVRRKPLLLIGNIDIDGSISPEKTLIAIYTEAIQLFAPGSHYTGSALPIYKLFKGIKQIQGVLSIHSLEFQGFEEGEYAYTLALSSPEQIKIRLYQNQQAVEINATKVLNRLHSRNNINHAIREQKKQAKSILMDSRHIHLNDYSVTNDFPICYKDSFTDSFKAYLSIFDHLFSEGHEEMNHLKDWMALNMETPGSASMEQNKDLLLDTLDKIYGENSNLPFLRYSHKEINRQRRVRFLRQLPELIRDRYLGCNLFDADSLSGLERYLYSILGWEDAEEQIFILENILLHSPEATDHPVPSREFTLTAILSQTERTRQRPDFQLRLEEFLREKIPAHLRFTVHWLPPKELALFVKDYKAWRKAWADNDNKEIGRTGEVLKNNLIRINIEL
ncbi:MAG TPA: hypothetical protein DD441_14055 [Parabacteroides distasonis]|nr:hypothetical protein [Parabacteroides distasonis]